MRESSGTRTGETPSAAASQRARATRRNLLALLSLLLLAGLLAPAGAEAARPPVLSVHGEALNWTARGRHNTYRLMARVVGGQHTSSIVHGLSITPEAVPGETVVYRVKAAYNESRWSNPVSITYQGEPVEEGEEEEPPVEEEPSNGEAAGDVKYRLDARTYFNRFATPDRVPWLQKHASLVKAYAPFGDVYVGFGLPTISYHDPSTEGFAPLTPTSIASYVTKVTRDARVGYAGAFIDDVNLTLGFRDGTQSREREPEKHRLALLVEAVRDAQPKGILEVNTQYYDIWPLLKAHDPDAERILQQVDIMTKEFGVGPTSGIDTRAEYAEFFNYVEYLHARGIALMLCTDPNAGGVPGWEYNIATYFLFNNGDDYINGVEQTPSNWWSGYDVNLGDALGPRERSASGLWTRRFTRGVAYTVEPGGATQTIRLGKVMHSAEWGDVESVTLKERQGAVLEQ